MVVIWISDLDNGVGGCRKEGGGLRRRGGAGGEG